MDLNDLDWEDRERVLRLLFSKMNAGVPANNQGSQFSTSGAGVKDAIEGGALPAIGFE